MSKYWLVGKITMSRVPWSLWSKPRQKCFSRFICKESMLKEHYDLRSLVVFTWDDSKIWGLWLHLRLLPSVLIHMWSKGLRRCSRCRNSRRNHTIGATTDIHLPMYKKHNLPKYLHIQNKSWNDSTEPRFLNLKGNEILSVVFNTWNKYLVLAFDTGETFLYFRNSDMTMRQTGNEHVEIYLLHDHKLDLLRGALVFDSGWSPPLRRGFLL